MKILANGNSESDKLQKLYDIADEMVDLLEKDRISQVELWDCSIYPPIPEIGIIKIRVEGDWKHDLLRSKYLITQNFNIIKSETESLEDTGSDWGPELQSYYIYLD